MARPLPALLIPALVAAASAPAARAVFAPGTKTILGRGLGLHPLGVACWDDDHVFVLDASPGCTDCVTPRAWARCRHKPAGLVHFHRKDGTWSASRLACDLPASALCLAAAPGRTLVVGACEGLLQVYLVGKGDGWRVLRTETLLPWSALRDMGPAAEGFETFTVEPDGALVLGFGRAVARLRPERGRPGRPEWLLEPPAEASKAAATPAAGEGIPNARGMLVAHGDDRVFVVDRRTRAVYGLDRTTRKRELLLTARQWPEPEFLPTRAFARGRTLYVAGEASPKPGARTLLCALEPAGAAYEVTGPQVEILKGAPFTITPAGHLLIADYLGGWAWHIENSRAAQPEAKAVDGAAAARAEAAYQELLEELAEAAAEEVLAEPGPEARTERAEDGDRVPAAAVAAGPPLEVKPAGPPPVATRAGAGAASSAAGPPGEEGAWISVEARKRPAASVEAKPLWAPAGRVNQRDIVARARTLAGPGRFAHAFGAWVAQARREGVGGGLGRRVALADRSRSLEPPGTEPRGLDRFTLSEIAIRRAAQWILLEAGRANPAGEVAAWRVRTPHGPPRFSFGLFEHARRPQAMLEVADLLALADPMDDLPGMGSLAGELASMDGVTGVQRTRDGLMWFTYGLSVVLGAEPGAGFSVRPGGARAAVHDWSEPEPAEAIAPPAAGAAPAQPAPTAGTEPQAPAAPAAAPPPTPSRLNPRAKPFVMPESPAGTHP